MALSIVRYEESHVPAVRRLNERMAAAKEPWRFSERPQSLWLPDTPGEEIVEHYYVAVEGDEVRGGYVLKWQPFWTSKGMQHVCTLYLPLSEGIINPAYKLLGLALISDALKRNPRAFCLGMAGAARPLPQTLRMLGWQVHDIPFFFLPLRASAFLRHLQPLQSRTPVRWAAHLAARSGVAALALSAFKWLWRPGHAVRTGVSAESVEGFGPWADDIWVAARDQYTLCADRGSLSLNRLYPKREGENKIVRVSKHGKIAGWFVARSRLMKGHKHFGDMRVGSLIDAMALPGSEMAVTWAARIFLEQCGSDIMVCSMQHRVWRDALKAAGWLSGPSNFAFAASKALSAVVGAPYEQAVDKVHILRGDGEGPTNL